MAKHPLDGPRLKITRAMQNFDALHAEMAQFTEAHPYPVHITVDPDTGGKLYQVGKPPDWPETWGVIVGEVGYSLRSALDNLVFQLAREGGGQPDEQRTAFPISLDRSEYWEPRGRQKISYRDQCLVGVADQWKKKIDDVQPYHRLTNANLHELAILNSLCNRDKHRVHHAVHAMIYTEREVVTVESDWEELSEVEIRLTPSQTTIKTNLKPGSRAGDQSAIGIYPQVNMNHAEGIDIAFGPERVSMAEVKRLITYTGRLIDWFEPAFDPPAAAD